MIDVPRDRVFIFVAFFLGGGRNVKVYSILIRLLVLAVWESVDLAKSKFTQYCQSVYQVVVCKISFMCDTFIKLFYSL